MEKLEGMLGLDAGDLADMLISIGMRIGIALAVLIVGFWMAKMMARGVVKVLEKRDTDQSLIGFMRSLTSVGLKTLVVVTAVTQLGVEMTSFVALLGAAGLAIGMAFSGTLSNFAGGVMILLFKPFKVDDFVMVQGEEGFVKEILIFNTILSTFDNKTIILANGAVANGTIVNYTKAEIRRVDIMFGISYGDDLLVAKKLLNQFMEDDARVLTDPAPFLGVAELGDSSVNIKMKAWVKTDDYWDVFYAMNEKAYLEFEKAGLTIPFPQMDVHIQKEAAE